MKTVFGFIQALMLITSLTVASFADVTIKQRVTVSGQKFESTRRIKGSRERTEQHIEMADPAMAAYMPQIATVTQCDMKRRIEISDRKQLYFVEPFETPEPENAARPAHPAQPAAAGPARAGGTMTMTYNVRDTGERKTMFGLQARHMITTQEMETSADSCNGPSKSKYEYDGWYVDFASDFSCPSVSVPYTPGRMPKPDCVDHVVRRGTGTAPKGMMLEGTMKIYGPDGSVQMTQTTETVELNRDALDASLFDIPTGYKLAGSLQDLYAVSMPTYGGDTNDNRPTSTRPNVNPMMPPKVSKSVAVTITGAGANQTDVDTYVRNKLVEKGLRVVSGTADYTVNVNFRQIKESTAGKIGGIFGKVTGAPTGGVGKVDIDLVTSMSGKATSNANVKNKFDGPLSAALRLALDQALDQLLANIRQ
jgi:hypothetical protein